MCKVALHTHFASLGRRLSLSFVPQGAFQITRNLWTLALRVFELNHHQQSFRLAALSIETDFLMKMFEEKHLHCNKM